MTGLSAIGGDEMPVGYAFVERVVDDDMAVGHGWNHAHLMAYEDDGGVWCYVGDDAVDVFLEVLVDVA